MRAQVKKASDKEEYWFEEGCFILEVANDEEDEYLSIARVRVQPFTRTKAHKLMDISERYIIVSGEGRVEIGAEIIEEVSPGDVVRIPAGVRQRVINTTAEDLVFYAVCAPPFRKERYLQLQEQAE